MKKSKVTRSLMAACSIVALSAVMYGCVHSGDSAPPEVEAPDLGPAQMAAKSAADAAEAASDAAAAAVAGAAASSSADPASYVEARDAAAAARAAARAAAAANADAAAATTLEDAAAAQRAAEAAQAEAEDARDDAVMYAGMVTAAQADLDQAEADRIEAEAQAERDRLAEIEDARQAIAAAETEAEAQAAATAVNDVASVAEAAELQRLVEARKDELATMDRAADQKMALTTAAGNVDTSDLMTQADIAAANMAIAALQMALDEAVDVSDADKAMYQGQLDAAEMAVATAQNTLDRTNQMTALDEAVEALQMLDLSNLSTQEAIGAAEDAIAGLRTALDNATELTDAEKTAAMTELAAASRNVMVAKERVDTNSQMTMLADAVAALGMIDLDDLMTQAQIDAANKAIIELDMALEAATNLTDAQKLDALTDVTLAKRKVTAAETTLAENVGNQRTALTNAAMALGEIDLDDLDTPEKITAANNAVMALEAALGGATHLSEAQKAMYQSQLDTADEAVKMAQTGMDRDGRMMAQRTAITNAVSMARTAVAGVSDTSTDSEVASADAAVKAVKDAIAAAEDLSENAAEIISAKAVLETIEPLLANAKKSRMAYLEKKAEDDGKANAATGKALHAALAGNATADTTALDNAVVTWPDTGDTAGRLTITPTAGAGANADTVTLEPVTFMAGSSAGALGSWMGMNYADMEGTGDDKVTTEARVYTNKGPGKSEPFADAGYTIIEAGTDNAGSVLLVTDGTVETAIGDLNDVMATAFEHSGTQTHAIPENTVALKVRGTFDGAPGEFMCTGTCTSTNDGSGAPSGLGGTWHFKPDAGAMVHQPDAHYLYYGWWVSKGSDGMPTAASAFAGRFGTEAADDGLDPAGTLSELTGSATYVGNAAGKFAITNVLESTGNGGHFTADAELNAKFSGTDPGVTGTIDNFRLNDGTDDPGWSVALMNGGLGADGAITAATGDDVLSTVWSINGNKAEASGTWSGTMYDEMPGDAPDGDGSNIPTTVTGTFYSEFSTIGRMVGAFGADKQ